MFYRFKNGLFVEAETFAEAQQKIIDKIKNERETEDGWHRCVCTGFHHDFGCPEDDGEDDIPF